MKISAALDSSEVWQEFVEYKRESGHLNRDEERKWSTFLEERAYLPVAVAIRAGECFPPPRRSEISKLNSEKKRVVYTYPDAENRVLKLITYLLQRKYDTLFAENLYSFRPGKSVRHAVAQFVRMNGIRQMWSYKVDIHNYFNSVPVERMVPMLYRVLEEEPELARFLASLLENPLVESNGNFIPEQKGIMAGVPFSTFLANLYLREMDLFFEKAGILYARYSDDVIVFAETEALRDEYAAKIGGFLAEAGLSVNPEKEMKTGPGEAWVFLGVCFRDGVVDVAPVSVVKLKAKMRRKMRALERWQRKKGVERIRAAKAFVRVFHEKLFENPAENELTWSRWYFPLINTADSLRKIDRYRQNCIRYLATGKRTKAAYNFRYEEMKELGYVSLVHEFYRDREKTEETAGACEDK